jgi:hypothetical protein
VWNSATGTIAYPDTRFTMEFGGQPALYGIGAWSKENGEWSPASEFYMNLVLTLGDGTRAATFSGTPVDIRGLKPVVMKETEVDTITGRPYSLSYKGVVGSVK